MGDEEREKGLLKYELIAVNGVSSEISALLCAGDDKQPSADTIVRFLLF